MTTTARTDWRALRAALLAILSLSMVVPASAQTATVEQDDPPVQSDIQPQGRVADSAVGEIGQRQTREETKGVAPMARIANRIQNRVQSRVRNRIDRDYDPQANATSPFATAQDQVSTTGPR